MAKEVTPPAFLAPHPSELPHLNQSSLANDDDDDDDDGDYAEVLSPDFYIDRKQIQMVESLGNGQFGEVYQGILKVSRDHPSRRFISLVGSAADGGTQRNGHCHQNM